MSEDSAPPQPSQPEAGQPAAAQPEATPLQEIPPDEAGFGETIEAWLKLWVGANALFLTWTLVILSRRGVSSNHLVEAFALGCLANVCFLIGPGGELYARRHGYRGRALRWNLLSATLILGLSLIALALVAPSPAPR